MSTTSTSAPSPMYRDDLKRINLNAAGIDVGAREMYVAVPPDRSETPVRSFGTYTADLHSLAQWLSDCGITSAAMAQECGQVGVRTHPCGPSSFLGPPPPTCFATNRSRPSDAVFSADT